VSIIDHSQSEKLRFIENCTQCGLCAEGCPILPFTDSGEVSPQEIQECVFDFMNSGIPNQHAYTKAFACMECFKCTVGLCPEDLDPMLVNEFIKSAYISKGLASEPYGDAMLPHSTHRVLASVLVSGADYRNITNRSHKPHTRFVFFPGCNVYLQPDKICSALDIMDAIGDDYAFLPGLDYCCGDSAFFLGDFKKASKRAEDLVAAISGFQPEAVIVWCPTCLCRFEHNIAPGLNVDFRILSFPQYLAGNMNKLTLSDAAAGIVTLHEACKSAYTALDLDGTRDVLQQLPGVKLREMAHHGKKTDCCGSGAACWFPESCDRFCEKRLNQASQTGADRLVTVCHYCGQAFLPEEKRFKFNIINYVQLVAAAMGIQRDDKFRQYALWGNLDQILDDAREKIQNASFGRERIIEALQTVFAK
jgi:Fe-S oxidoreductase